MCKTGMNSVKFIPNKSQSKVLAKNSKTNAELTYFLCKRLVWEPILWTGPENTALDSISGKRTLLFLRCLGASWRALLKSRNSHKTHGIYCFRKKNTGIDDFRKITFKRTCGGWRYSWSLSDFLDTFGSRKIVIFVWSKKWKFYEKSWFFEVFWSF